jgi:hypothetical protein
MKLSELKPCAVCKGKIAPFWYVVRFSMAMISPHAANGVMGLTQMFGGNLALAEAMAPEPDCVKVLGDEEPDLMTEVNICQECFLMKPLNMALLMESAREEEPVTT